jgi:hypothetical protein
MTLHVADTILNKEYKKYDSVCNIRWGELIYTLEKGE